MPKEIVVQSYEIFKQKCQAIIDSKYIMSDNHIISLLRYIASTPCLAEFLAKCNQGLDYKAEYNEASSGASFRLPQSKRRIVALVSGMLFDIDQHELNFGAFLIKYFGNDDYEVSFGLFCKSVLVPYMEAFGMILKDDIEDDSEIEDGNNGVVIDESVKEQIYPYISAVKELVENDISLKDRKKEEFLTMLDGFNYVIELFNCKMIKVVWIGLKSVMFSYRPVQSFLKSLESILADFAII